MIYTLCGSTRFPEAARHHAHLKGHPAMAEELTATQGISACPDCCAAIGAPCAAGMPGHGYDCLDCGVNWSELEIRSVWVRFGLVVGVSMLATLSMISFMWVADTEWWKVISLVLIGMVLIWCMDRVER